jgi:hypothetical protein
LLLENPVQLADNDQDSVMDCKRPDLEVESTEFLPDDCWESSISENRDRNPNGHELQLRRDREDERAVEMKLRV